MIYIHAKHHHHKHNSLLEDRSYILFLFVSWHAMGPQDVLAKLILSAERETGPAIEHPPSRTSELSLDSFKKRMRNMLGIV